MDLQGLKEKILQLAIQGKLVTQDPNDEPASVLLERIRAERERLIKEGKIKKQKQLPEITDEEKPFEIPENWEWVRLGEVTIINPRNLFEDEKQASFVPMALIDEGFKNNHAFEVRLWKDIKKGFTHFAENDVAVAKITPCFENRKSVIMRNLVNGIGAGTTELHIIRSINELVLPAYILIICKTDRFIKDGISTYTGTAGQQRISKDFIMNYLIPLPPLAEQKRIVEKVNKLFALIDKLDSDKKELLEIINLTRNQVLQLAVQGKLIAQDPNDEPASVLLERIRAERERLIKEGKMKKQKPLPEITDEEKPFEIPENWEWVRLGEVGAIIGGGTPKTTVKEYWEGGTIPWITPADLSNYKEKYISKGKRCITPLGLKESSAQLMPKGTVLFSSRAPIGYTAIAKNEVSTNQGFKSCVPFITDMSEFIYYYLTYSAKIIKENASGTTFKEVSGTEVSSLIFPLPPLAEQKRIVEKVDIIMNMLDEAESELTAKV
ncbi:MAG TPA: restriction endonuclease subunit S [Clostridia bacterium]|nr:restriction endonuclease subunit S [Clostridia bacterium]